MKKVKWVVPAGLLISLALILVGCKATEIPASVGSQPSWTQPASSGTPSVLLPSNPELVIEDLNVQAAMALIQKQMNNPAFKILDVRTSEEFESGHLAGAINIDWRSADFKVKVADLNKEGSYLVYCGTGIRSASAVQAMSDLGFKQLYNMEGGIVALIADGFPVVN